RARATRRATSSSSCRPSSTSCRSSSATASARRCRSGRTTRAGRPTSSSSSPSTATARTVAAAAAEATRGGRGVTILLAIELPDGAVENLALQDAPQFVIGRDPACHVVLPSPEVSRRHVRLDVYQGGVVTLTDMSANGTIVGGERVVQ